MRPERDSGACHAPATPSTQSRCAALSFRRERLVSTMGAITLRLSRRTARGPQRLEVCGQRLLVGHADTGIFKIGGPKTHSAVEPAAPGPPSVRQGDDGLASAVIEVATPLAIMERDCGGDPRSRRDLASRGR